MSTSRLDENQVVTTYVATSEVTTLKHELRDHAMEFRLGIAKPLLTSAKGTEVFGGLRYDIVIEVEIDSTGLNCISQRQYRRAQAQEKMRNC